MSPELPPRAEAKRFLERELDFALARIRGLDNVDEIREWIEVELYVGPRREIVGALNLRKRELEMLNEHGLIGEQRELRDREPLECVWLDENGEPYTRGNSATEKITRLRSDRVDSDEDRGYRDEAWLRERYVDEKLSTYEIADRCQITKATVLYWMDKFGIERRDPNLPSNIPEFDTSIQGYERVRTAIDGQRLEVLIHRLAAVAWFGWDAVVGNDVHHKNDIRWDNREENLEPLSHSEHSKITRRRVLDRNTGSDNGENADDPDREHTERLDEAGPDRDDRDGQLELEEVLS